jgi:hypothetical protein
MKESKSLKHITLPFLNKHPCHTRIIIKEPELKETGEGPHTSV